MNRFKILLLAMLSHVLLACSSEEKGKSSDSTTPKQDNTIDYTITQTKKASGLSLKNIQLTTNSKKDNINGLTVTCDVEIKPEIFDAIKKDGFSGIFIDLKVATDNNKVIFYRDELFKNKDKKKFININRENFISSFGGRTIEIFVPYRYLELKEGSHSMQIEIAAFPVQYEDENTSLNMRLMKSISDKPITASTLECHLNTPELYTISFSVIKAKIDPQLKDPSKYDVALSGKGYPDIFWEVFCGNDYIYYSPVEKNKKEYLKKFTSPIFSSTKDDIINFALVDYDNGPFNTQDDIIGAQKFKTSEIKNTTDTLQFGNLEYIIIQTTSEVVK